MKPADHLQCPRYVEWVLEQQALHCNFSNQIFFSDEAHFAFGWCVNKQNCRNWGSEDSQVIEEEQLHPEKVIVWCALWFEVVIGPNFFQNNSRMTVTANSERYWYMITDFFLLAIEEYDLRE